jgi:EF-P beta-lysylation protein EpmB
MISESVLSWQRSLTWQQLQANAIRDPAVLWARLALPVELLPAAQLAAQTFALRVPEPYLARIRPGNVNDPLLRQVLPLMEETHVVTGFVADPVGDQAAMLAPGILHKYAGRVLLVATGACAIHCRYCFRRHFPYAQANAAAAQWQEALAVIAADSSITEVILSGGDPLSLADERLNELIQALLAIPHVRRLRLHTRLPVVIPQRITPALLEMLSHSRLQCVLVIHTNHPNEIDTTLCEVLNRVRASGITLLNQAVLLRGINDDIATLVELSEALFAAGVLPYYLHQLDKVQGAAHFEVDVQVAQGLIAGVRDRLPGYLVPRLVKEIPGMAAKLPL